MPHKVSQFESAPIIMIEIEPTFKPREEIPQIHEKLDKLAQKLPRPIFRIVDLTHSKLDFGTAVEAMSEDASNASGSATDWRFKLLFVGRDNIAKMISDSTSQEQYGGIESRFFTSRQAAVKHARQELKRLKH